MNATKKLLFLYYITTCVLLFSMAHKERKEKKEGATIEDPTIETPLPDSTTTPLPDTTTSVLPSITEVADRVRSNGGLLKTISVNFKDKLNIDVKRQKEQST